MKYLNEQGLAKVRQADSDRLDRLYRKKSSGLWVQSEKTGAVGIYPVGGSELHPVVDFKFTETLPEGDKGPDNPSTITGVSSVVLAHGSSNIFYLNGFPSSFASVSISVDGDGVIELNGTCVATQIDGRQWVQPIAPPARILRLPGQYLHAKIEHLSGTLTTTGTMDRVLSEMSETIIDTGAVNYRYITTNSPAATFAPSTSLQRLGRPTISFYGGQTFTNYRFRVIYKISDSSQMSEYDPPHTVFTTIPLGNTYYGGSVDLSTGVMTVTYKRIEFSGNEGISTSSDGSYYIQTYYDPMDYSIYESVSTHFPFTGTRANPGLYPYLSDSSVRFGFGLPTSAMWSNTTAVKNYLQTQYSNGTPVSVCYKLYTPFTVQLSPVQISALTQTDKYMPRLNTLYTDQEALQVGYLKSPARASYEIDQAIIEGGA